MEGHGELKGEGGRLGWRKEHEPASSNVKNVGHVFPQKRNDPANRGASTFQPPIIGKQQGYRKTQGGEGGQLRKRRHGLL